MLALNENELAQLGENGFVISRRSAFPTFVRGYAAIYSEHLPVYISANAILEARKASCAGSTTRCCCYARRCLNNSSAR